MRIWESWSGRVGESLRELGIVWGNWGDSESWGGSVRVVKSLGELGRVRESLGELGRGRESLRIGESQ